MSRYNLSFTLLFLTLFSLPGVQLSAGSDTEKPSDKVQELTQVQKAEKHLVAHGASKEEAQQFLKELEGSPKGPMMLNMFERIDKYSRPYKHSMPLPLAQRMHAFFTRIDYTESKSAGVYNWSNFLPLITVTSPKQEVTLTDLENELKNDRKDTTKKLVTLSDFDSFLAQYQDIKNKNGYNAKANLLSNVEKIREAIFKDVFGLGQFNSYDKSAAEEGRTILPLLSFLLKNAASVGGQYKIYSDTDDILKCREAGLPDQVACDLIDLGRHFHNNGLPYDFKRDYFNNKIGSLQEYRDILARGKKENWKHGEFDLFLKLHQRPDDFEAVLKRFRELWYPEEKRVVSFKRNDGSDGLLVNLDSDDELLEEFVAFSHKPLTDQAISLPGNKTDSESESESEQPRVSGGSVSGARTERTASQLAQVAHSRADSASTPLPSRLVSGDQQDDQLGQATPSVARDQHYKYKQAAGLATLVGLLYGTYAQKQAQNKLQRERESARKQVLMLLDQAGLANRTRQSSKSLDAYLSDIYNEKQADNKYRSLLAEIARYKAYKSKISGARAGTWGLGVGSGLAALANAVYAYRNWR